MKYRIAARFYDFLSKIAKFTICQSFSCTIKLLVIVKLKSLPMDSDGCFAKLNARQDFPLYSNHVFSCDITLSPYQFTLYVTYLHYASLVHGNAVVRVLG